MASLIDDGEGKYRISWTVGPEKRRTMRLGKISRRQAVIVHNLIEGLISAKMTGRVDDGLAKDLARVSPNLRDRLAKLQLCEPGERKVETTLLMLLDEYRRQTEGNKKSTTLVTQMQTRKALIDFLGEKTLLTSVTALEASRWRVWQQDERGLAQSTIARRVKQARQFWRKGNEWGLVAGNPFSSVRAGAMDNPDRLEFVSREVVAKVMEACPDRHWRLLVALARFGGLRTPSEPFAMRVDDIDWAAGKLRVRSSKTEHLRGGGIRYCPIFPELKGPLLESYEGVAEGAEFLLPGELRGRGTGANLRTRFMKIIRRAGVKSWPRLFHGLRGSRQTELAAEWPLHVVCQWLGNSEAVAAKHYLTVREEDYRKAAAGKGTQFGTQSELDRGLPAGTAETGNVKKPPVIEGFSRLDPKCPDLSKGRRMTPRGVEPLFVG